MDEIFLSDKNIANQTTIEYTNNWEHANDPTVPFDIIKLSNKIHSNICHKGYSLHVALQISIKIMYIPDSVQILDYNHSTNYIDKFPKNLKKLYCEGITQIPALPEGLEELYCINAYVRELPSLPESLRVLVCTRSYIKHIPNIPSNLEHLDYVEQTDLSLDSNFDVLKDLEIDELSTNTKLFDNVQIEIKKTSIFKNMIIFPEFKVERKIDSHKSIVKFELSKVEDVILLTNKLE